jgi:hypothetical protein
LVTALALDQPNEWQQRLERSPETTKYSHYTVLADGVVGVGSLGDGFSCRPGRALMTMHVWASDSGESIDMIREIGTGIGFTFDGEIDVFATPPSQLPKRSPYGYDIHFVAYGR